MKKTNNRRRKVRIEERKEGKRRVSPLVRVLH
jgi:hypothetical protein